MDLVEPHAGAAEAIARFEHEVREPGHSAAVGEPVKCLQGEEFFGLRQSGVFGEGQQGNIPSRSVSSQADSAHRNIRNL